VAKRPKLSTNPQADFDSNAKALAERFLLDANDVKKAFADKPESLSAYFNAATQASYDRTRNAKWGVAWLILCWPVTFYNAYRVGTTWHDLYKIEKTLQGDVARVKGLPPAPERKELPPAPSPSQF
jgi:hypothetical protein